MNEKREMKMVGEGKEDEERTDELTSVAVVAAASAVLAAFSLLEGSNMVASQVQGLMPRSVHVSIRRGYLRCKRSDDQWTIRAS